MVKRKPWVMVFQVSSNSSIPTHSLPSLSNSDSEISAPEPCLELVPVIPTQALDTDLPIALRKGTRTCTKHPITKYISYNNLSDNYRAFTTKYFKPCGA